MYGKPAVGRKTNAGWCESISRRATESRSINGRSGGTTERRNDSDRFSRGKPGVGWFGEVVGRKTNARSFGFVAMGNCRKKRGCSAGKTNAGWCSRSSACG